ncbi:PAS domain S-box protein [Sulfurospirillum sp. hDNRA2]|uniref:PAS domain S-box protein n=1 Tax=Sulfurospirillum sp. hDNRA2 TaxID=3237298 RepID=UPI0020B7125A|nr:PAS domain S-box protein [Sulfurospirillum sp. DNRA8]MCP3651694.1 PAS domain S-box protein [Sulfurospirillum sp. DNRA8]MCR1810541.1 PAS domain S-box protein [Sulfurospirillum sp. DNRA8]
MIENTQETRKTSMLILESSLVFSNVLQKNLCALNYRVTHAKTLYQAVELLSVQTFDVIVLDLHLRDGEGEMILQNLSILDPKLKMIVYSIDHDPNRSHTWDRYGVLAFLSKSDPIAHIVRKIDALAQSCDQEPRARLLWIGELESTVQHVRTLLHVRNYRLFVAQSQEEAFSFAPIDLILLELDVYDTASVERLRQVRAAYAEPQTPIFIVTQAYDSALLHALIQNGANEFFVKPLLGEMLGERIDFWLERQRIQSAQQREGRLLQEYKNVIDKSMIVSKTDPHGIITYVNEQFCDISGYRADELIGRSHRIVRHPDTPESVFQDLWKTILSGNIWKGVLKNRKKDGSAYWVHAFIYPIITRQGQIDEVIAIRNDVTQLHLVKESLSRALQRSDSDLDEAFHLSKQYETVIDESNSLTRVDTEGKILFVNKRFCELSGYAKEEVIEQSFSAMYADDIDPLIVKQLWETIQSGHIWRGVLKNKRKDGSLYWVKATVVPIKDKQGKITEFMSVRNDISEIIKLHEEIESTQQEIIYHMGEIAESRSQETGNHVRRVAEYSRLLALKYGLDAQEANKIAMASPMHDIGKVGIPDAILHKPGKLTDEEWEIMKTHAMLGYAVLQHSKRPILQASAIIAKEHHEKYDGTGYPLGLSGEAIHLYARIVAIADVFDALSHDRCYKKAWEDADVFAFFEKERGAHFDPQLVDMFLAAKEEFLTIRDHFKDALNP